MSKRSFRRFILTAISCLIGASPNLTNAVSAGNRPVVIVNSETTSNLLLSQNALSAIFGMRLRKWEDGSPIRVFVLPDDDHLHVEFSKYVLHVFPYQLRAAWDRLVFSGTGEEPVKVKSEQQMKELVGSTPGAIGYLRGSMIDATVKAIAFE